MGQKATIHDVTLWTVGGTALLGTFTGGTITVEGMEEDGATATSKAAVAETVKKTATVDFEVIDNVGGSRRLNNLDVSAFTVGGTAYVASLVSGSINIGYVQDGDVSGEADLWTYAQNIRLGDVTIEGTLKIEGSGTPNLPILAASATLADTVVDVTVTINSVSVTMPMRISRVSHVIQRDAVQEMQVTLKIRDDGDTNIPNAPTGTTSLMEKAFNAYKTALACTLTTDAASQGLTYSGNFIFNSFNVQFENAAIIKYAVQLVNQGTVTVATAA